MDSSNGKFLLPTSVGTWEPVECSCTGVWYWLMRMWQLWYSVTLTWLVSCVAVHLYFPLSVQFHLFVHSLYIFHLSICPFTFIWLSVSPSVFLSVSVRSPSSQCLFLHLSLSVSVHLPSSQCLSLHLSLSVSVRAFIPVSVFPSVLLSECVYSVHTVSCPLCLILPFTSEVYASGSPRPPVYTASVPLAADRCDYFCRISVPGIYHLHALLMCIPTVELLQSCTAFLPFLPPPSLIPLPHPPPHPPLSFLPSSLFPSLLPPFSPPPPPTLPPLCSFQISSPSS